MIDLNKEREAFSGFLRTKGVVKVGWNSLGVLTNLVREAGCTLNYNDIELMQETWMAKAKVTTWQPIETAPKDRDVLLKNHEGIFQGKWDKDTKTFDPLFMEYHGCGCCLGEDPKPTQWMELPLVVESGAIE